MTGKNRSRGMVLAAPPASSPRKGYDPGASMRASEQVLQLDASAEIRRLSTPDAEHPVTLIDMALIDVHLQVRRYFDVEKLEALRLSIKEDGVRDAVLLRPAEDGRYDLVFGERRMRASKLAELTLIPSVIRELSDQKVTELQIQENQQREPLSAIEQAEAGVKLLAGHWNASPADVISRLQVYQRSPEAHADEITELEPYWNRNMAVTWRTFTVKRLPLARLPEAVKEGLFANRYSEAQARALARLGEDTQAELLGRLPLPDLAALGALAAPTAPKKTPEPRDLLTPTHRRALGSLKGDRADRAGALLSELAELLG